MTLKDTNREIILMSELYIFVPCENPVELGNGVYGSPTSCFFKWEQVIPDIGEPRIEILTTW